jgi:hypothetical protein
VLEYSRNEIKINGKQVTQLGRYLVSYLVHLYSTFWKIFVLKGGERTDFMKQRISPHRHR